MLVTKVGTLIETTNYLGDNSRKYPFFLINCLIIIHFQI